MESSTTHFSRDEARELLTSILAPRPVGWISTISADPSHYRNLAPFSSVSPVCNKPPLLSFSCGRKSDGSRKDTAKNVLETGEFVINFAGPALLDKIALSANEFETCVDEFELTGVTPEASRLVAPPRVLESLASLECRVHRVIELGDDDCKVDFIIGIIVHACLRGGVWGSQPGCNAQQFFGIGALGLDWYLVNGEARFCPQPPLAKERRTEVAIVGGCRD